MPIRHRFTKLRRSNEMASCFTLIEIYRRGSCVLVRHPTAKTGQNRSVGYIELLSRLGDCIRYIVNYNAAIISSIVLLINHRCPAAVCRLESFIDICSFEGKSLRASSHVFNKVSEAADPARAHCYSSASVMSIFGNVGIAASAFRVGPASIFFADPSASGIAMFSSLTERIIIKTSAAFRATTPQKIGVNNG